MTTTFKWILGIVVGSAVLFALPFAWQALFPAFGYGVMGTRHMPMMGGYGFMPFGGFFMWLIPLGLLTLIVLGIAALVKYLTKKPDVAEDAPM